MKSPEFNLNMVVPEGNTDPELKRLKDELFALKAPMEDAIAKQNLPLAEKIFVQIEEAKKRFDDYKESLKKIQNDPEYTPDITKFQPEQIANGIDEVSEKTIIYIGEWNPTIYQKIKNYPNITHLYESFPDKKIFTYELTTDPSIQSSEQAKQKLEAKNIWISDYGKDLLDKTEFSKEQKQYKLVQFTVAQLGFSSGATTDEIYRKAEELGLKLCPAEVGPQLRLVYEGKDWKRIAMKQITDRFGGPGVLHLNSDDAELRLSGRSARPGRRWDPDRQFVFLAS